MHPFCKVGFTIALLGALSACARSSSLPNSSAGPVGSAANDEGAHGSPLALQVNAGYGRRQLTFEPNRGQADGRVNFLARGGEYSLFLEPTEAVLTQTKPPHATVAEAKTARGIPRPHGHGRVPDGLPETPTSPLRLQLVGASAMSTPAGESPLPGKVNVYLGNDPKRWQENIPTFGKVRYADVYPGVDLVYYGTDGQLEYDFVVAPGADPGNIRLAFEGGRPKIDARGDLVFAMGDTEIRLGNLVVYQEKGGQRESVPGRLVLAGDHHARFAVGEYDHSRALVIDPTVVYATYIGGAGSVYVSSVAVDSTGSAVITGSTGATGFPVTSGAYQSAFSSADSQCFLAKFAPDGSSLVFATYLGGGQGTTQDALSVAVDPQDNIYVAGYAQQSYPTTTFPTTAGALQPLIGGGQDGFVAKFGPTGTLAYSSFLGGCLSDQVNAIAVDSAGDAFVTGVTGSALATGGCEAPSTVFPTTSTAYQAPFPEPIDPGTGMGGGSVTNTPFLSEIDPTGSTLLYSTLLSSGACVDQCADRSSCANSTHTCASGSGSCTAYCPGQEIGNTIALGKAGVAYIGGWTADVNFPTTAGAFQTVAPPVLNPNGVGAGTIGFVAGFDTTKSGAASLVFSTLLGDPNCVSGDQLYGVAADPDGNVYATGVTNCPGFPTTSGSYAPACTASSGATPCAGSEGFVTKLDPTGSTLVYSTYLADPSNPYSYDGAQGGIALDSARNAYVYGSGIGSAFPLVNPLNITAGIGSIQTLSADGSKLLFSTFFKPGPPACSGPVVCNGFTVDQGGNIFVASNTGGVSLPATAGAFQTMANSLNSGYLAKISPIGASTTDGGSDASLLDASATDGAAAASSLDASATDGAAAAGSLDASAAGKGTADAGTSAAGRDASASDTGGPSGGSGCSVAHGNEENEALAMVVLGVLGAMALARRRRSPPPATGVVTA